MFYNRVGRGNIFPRPFLRNRCDRHAAIHFYCLLVALYKDTLFWTQYIFSGIDLSHSLIHVIILVIHCTWNICHLTLNSNQSMPYLACLVILAHIKWMIAQLLFNATWAIFRYIMMGTTHIRWENDEVYFVLDQHA